MVNVLADQFFFRLDFTEDKQYTLSKATKDILNNLDEPLMITAYFTEDLPQQLVKVKDDFSEMLVEYTTLSDRMVDYEFINPNDDPEAEQVAQQSGIQPVMVNMREKDQVKQQKVYMAAVLKVGERQEIIPFIQSGTGMEYALTTSIKKLAVVDKPSVAILQGYGMPSLNELGQVYQSLSILYNIEGIDLAVEEPIADRFRAVALVRPTDSIPPVAFAKLDDYLSRGGKLCMAVNAVQGDFSTAQGSAVSTGVGPWLRTKGLELESSFLVDAVCGSVSVQQQQGFFNMVTQVEFPYLPLIRTFPEHPSTKGIEQVIFEFASPINYTGDTSLNFTPLAISSPKSGIIQPPVFFDISQKMTNFPLSGLTAGAVLEGNMGGNLPAKLVLFSDGDFPVTGAQGGRGKSPDNINLLVNAMDWLSDDTGLIDLRTKGIASRPIADLEEGDAQFYKYMNFFLPLLLVFGYGLFRMQRKRNQRLKRMQERYV